MFVKTLPDLVTAAAANAPDNAALRFDVSEVMTYATLEQRIDRAADGFLDLGTARADRVAVYLPKQPETVIAMFAANRAGGVFIPVNPVLKAPQVAHILRDSGARILVTSGARAAALAGALSDCPDLQAIVIVDDELPEPIGNIARVAWSALLEADPQPKPVQIDADMAAILYTSGSTGSPKGVVLSHRNMLCGAQSVAEYLENDDSDCLLAALPLSFDYGFSQLSTAFLKRASVALMDYLVPKDILVACERYGVTGLAAVPPLWIQLAGQPWPAAVTESLRYITNSGGAMPTATLALLREKLPQTAVYLMYGLTEAFRSTYLPPDEIDRRPTSIGKAIPNAEIMVVAPDGTPCGPGEPGELVHRGALVSMGYWNDRDRTAVRFKPAPGSVGSVPIPEIAVWSGDTVTADEDGFLYFVGRQDEMIKTSGYRVSPTEVEEMLYASGLVSEAVALGAVHPVLGQAIVVVAVAAPGGSAVTAELVAACRQAAPAYMLPAHVEWCDALPRNANGKIDRSGLAARHGGIFSEPDDE